MATSDHVHMHTLHITYPNPANTCTGKLTHATLMLVKEMQATDNPNQKPQVQSAEL